jgi:tetraprenyl-beta-curcumene synthase
MEVVDPIPLSARQLGALAGAAARELVWGLNAVSQEIRHWKRLARLIPEAPIREDALATLARKRAHIAGAALFWTLPERRDPGLLRLLVTYEITLEFLDNVHERAGGRANGRQLHRALVEALDPTMPISDYYLLHPWRDDGGYLRALVQACRVGCHSLPRYPETRELLLQGARRCAEVQSLNHEAEVLACGGGLRDWAEAEFGRQADASWWEMTAAASSSIGTHALLALAACPHRQNWARVNAAYVPWLCAVSTLLDSYADAAADAPRGAHSYLDYYADREAAVMRLSELIRRSAREASGLPDGDRHSVILACMLAMYLSNDRVRTPAMRSSTARLVAAGGSLTRVLLPVLRLWRITYRQRSA